MEKRLTTIGGMKAEFGIHAEIPDLDDSTEIILTTDKVGTVTWELNSLQLSEDAENALEGV